jgi:hypothetical protein
VLHLLRMWIKCLLLYRSCLCACASACARVLCSCLCCLCLCLSLCLCSCFTCEYIMGIELGNGRIFYNLTLDWSDYRIQSTVPLEREIIHIRCKWPELWADNLWLCLYRCHSGYCPPQNVSPRTLSASGSCLPTLSASGLCPPPPGHHPHRW